MVASPAGAETLMAEADAIYNPWPAEAKFKMGDPVQRCNMPSGKPPAYRFPGRVCGWYMTQGKLGYCVSRDGDQGCIQIFPGHMLEARELTEAAKPENNSVPTP